MQAIQLNMELILRYTYIQINDDYSVQICATKGDRVFYINDQDNKGRWATAGKLANFINEKFGGVQWVR